METILEMAINHGLWAALFVGLLFYILRDTAKREKKYQDINAENQRVIRQLVENLRVVKEVQQDIGEIKRKVINSKK